MNLRHFNLKKAFPVSAMLLVLPLAACQIEREQRGELPEVDIEAGQLPQYDIKGPDVNVGVTEQTVTVPKVMIVQEEQTVQVPYVDVNVPGAESQERTITVEVEAPSDGYDLAIQDVYAVNDELWVVSRLTEEDPNAPQAAVRVSDRIVINAPDMPVRQYIVGDRPAGSFNEQYAFVDSRQAIAPQLEAGRQLYGQEQ